MDSGKVDIYQSVNMIYQGSDLKSASQYFWKIKIWDNYGNISEWSQYAYFSKGLLDENDWKGYWILKEDQDKKDHNWYRKNFILKKILIRHLSM